LRTPFARLLSFFLLLTALAVQPLWAGPLTGQVVDPDGRGVSGAAVVLTDGTSIVARAVTSASGRFTLEAPDTGEFEIRVAVEGFRAAPLTVTAGSTAKDLGTLELQISAVSESIVVSAAQVEIPLSSSTSSVTVITREDLDKHQVESVADALRSVPGLTVTSAGGRGAQTSVFPRGGESDYSLVFIDGIQANTFGGGFDFGHLPVVNIERIEIVRGPQSALYGSNAIGSVIRIVTRRGAPEGSALVEGGSFDTSRVAAASAGEVGAWNWGASAERLASDGYNGERAANGQIVENDDFERHLVSAAGGWRHGNVASLRADVRYLQDDRGFPGPFGSDPGGTYGGINTVSRGKNDRLLTSLGGSFPIARARINGEITHSRLDSEFASQFGDSESWSRRTTGRAQADMTLARGLEASAGLELLGERAGGTFITATGNELVPVERGMAGVFGEARWNHGARLFVTAGLRVERITRQALAADANAFPPRPAFDDDTVLSTNPKISAAWYLRSEDGNFTKVRGSAGTGIRPPDAFEIAFTDNPSLRPERSRSVEAGLDHAMFGGRGLVEATAFFNNYDDLIVATRTFADVSRYRTDNISNARSRGLEVAGTARARLAALGGAGLQVRVAYTLLDTEILAVDQSGSAPPPYTVGDSLIRRPKNQFSADVVVDAGRMTAFLQGNARSGVRDIDPSFGAPPFGAFYDAPGFSTWSLGASWRLIKNLDLFGRVTNLFDKDYEEAFGYPALGRAGIVGLRVAAGR
jgi:outer membrane cobalamin receptor